MDDDTAALTNADVVSALLTLSVEVAGLANMLLTCKPLPADTLAVVHGRVRAMFLQVSELSLESLANRDTDPRFSAHDVTTLRG
jgi:hypothetical protein